MTRLGAAIRNLARIHRAALVFTLASLAVWTGWNYGRALCHPIADLACGFYTDHYSIIGLTRAFVEFGPDAVYLQPRGEVGRPPSDGEQEALPPDVQQAIEVRIVDEWPADKPFISTYAPIPAFYPPGIFLLYGPAATVYSFSDISFAETNRLTIELLLVYAHITVFLLLIRASARSRIGLVVAALGYAMVIHWTLNGFSEGAWIAPLLLTPRYLVRRQPIPTLLTFLLAVFVHFRALFYLPWGAEGGVRLLANRAWRPWSAGRGVALAAISVMGIASAAAFFVLLGDMAGYSRTNPFHPGYEEFDLAKLVSLVLVAAAGSALLLWQRAFREVVMLVWIALVIATLPQINPAGAIVLLPWLANPEVEDGRGWVQETRVITGIFILGIVFPESIGVQWIPTAVSHLVG
ncbi:MAG TPA: hypothetical protein VG602_09220 [Actinomycetota bacterium]|nr:hypothetical protein [Actinomycetota bacterium]